MQLYKKSFRFIIYRMRSLCPSSSTRPIYFSEVRMSIIAYSFQRNNWFLQLYFFTSILSFYPKTFSWVVSSHLVRETLQLRFRENKSWGLPYWLTAYIKVVPGSCFYCLQTVDAIDAFILSMKGMCCAFNLQKVRLFR